jgi:hypothetical protein
MFRIMDVTRHKGVEPLRAYDRRAKGSAITRVMDFFDGGRFRVKSALINVARRI